jgi:hypothetical protein
MNVLIRKGSRPGDSDNGMFVTTVFSVIILSLAAAVLADVGQATVWNAASVLYLVRGRRPPGLTHGWAYTLACGPLPRPAGLPVDRF